MATQGTATIDFGAFPGKSDASLAISSPSIQAGSLVEAWLFPTATADHSVDEHLVDGPKIIAGNVQAGVGFTIYAIAPPNAGINGDTRCYGQWSVGWVWN